MNHNSQELLAEGGAYNSEVEMSRISNSKANHSALMDKDRNDSPNMSLDKTDSATIDDNAVPTAKGIIKIKKKTELVYVKEEDINRPGREDIKAKARYLYWAAFRGDV